MGPKVLKDDRKPHKQQGATMGQDPRCPDSNLSLLSIDYTE